MITLVIPPLVTANDKEVPELFRHLVPIPALPGQLPLESLDGDQRFANGSFHDGSRQTSRFPWAGLPPGPFSEIRPFVSQWGVLMDTLNFGDEHRRALLTRHFTQLIEKSGKPDEAQEIRRYFDAPAIDEEPADLREPDGDLLDRLAPDAEPPRQDEP